MERNVVEAATALNQGIYGAKRQSTEKVNPRALLKRTIQEMPHASQEKVWAEFVKRINNSTDDYDTPIRRYWFANNYRSMLFKPKSARISKKEVAEAKMRLGGKIQNFVLMNLMLPHGKRLRDSTGAECGRLANKMGLWLRRIAEQVGPREIVGEVLNEEDVQGLWKA
jgi:hypothetical protein